MVRISGFKALLCVLAALSTAGVASEATAAVIHASPDGFEIKQVVHIAAPAARVWAALIQPAKWWNSHHTYSGDAANLSLDPHPGGCFCEALPNGGGVQHLVVATVQPNVEIELRGALGPFHARGVDGALTFDIAPAGDGVDLTLTNDMGGYASEGLDGWAPKADAMLAEQMARIKRYVETGAP